MFTFVLGSCGIIGRAVVSELTRKNLQFVGIDKYSTNDIGYSENYIQHNMETQDSIGLVVDLVNTRKNSDRINIINCAGYDAKPTDNMYDPKEFEKMVMINQTWPVKFVQELLMIFNDNKCKLNLILLDTTYSKISPKPEHYKNGYIKPYDYILSKAYTESFVKYLTVHYPFHKFNSVAPHLVVDDEASLISATNLLKTGIVNRACKPEEISSVICYLIDPLSDFVKGTRIQVDGGWSS
jgi:NAD(P)-dependent dehydrogenase (short-subunit alcohol dehydrogenase family)